MFVCVEFLIYIYSSYLNEPKLFALKCPERIEVCQGNDGFEYFYIIFIRVFDINDVTAMAVVRLRRVSSEFLIKWEKNL